jgi:hypothetical protein
MTAVKAGRPKKVNKVKVRSAYLTDTDNTKIVKKFGSITDALKKVVLPKCG